MEILLSPPSRGEVRGDGASAGKRVEVLAHKTQFKMQVPGLGSISNASEPLWGRLVICVQIWNPPQGIPRRWPLNFLWDFKHGQWEVKRKPGWEGASREVEWGGRERRVRECSFSPSLEHRLTSMTTNRCHLPHLTGKEAKAQKGCPLCQRQTGCRPLDQLWGCPYPRARTGRQFLVFEVVGHQFFKRTCWEQRPGYEEWGGCEEIEITHLGDFPGGPVVKNPPSKAGDVGPISKQGA